MLQMIKRRVALVLVPCASFGSNAWSYAHSVVRCSSRVPFSFEQEAFSLPVLFDSACPAVHDAASVRREGGLRKKPRSWSTSRPSLEYAKQEARKLLEIARGRDLVSQFYVPPVWALPHYAHLTDFPFEPLRDEFLRAEPESNTYRWILTAICPSITT